MIINYTKQYQNYLSEFDFDKEYYIIETNSKDFDEYWQKYSYFNEAFLTYTCCTRIANYEKILNEIKSNKKHQIAYPIILWVDEESIKISQGRHRIRAIIDSGAKTIKVGVEKRYLDYLKKHLDIEIVEEFTTISL